MIDGVKVLPRIPPDLWNRFVFDAEAAAKIAEEHAFLQLLATAEDVSEDDGVSVHAAKKTEQEQIYENVLSLLKSSHDPIGGNTFPADYKKKLPHSLTFITLLNHKTWGLKSETRPLSFSLETLTLHTLQAFTLSFAPTLNICTLSLKRCALIHVSNLNTHTSLVALLKYYYPSP